MLLQVRRKSAQLIIEFAGHIRYAVLRCAPGRRFCKLAETLTLASGAPPFITDCPTQRSPTCLDMPPLGRLLLSRIYPLTWRRNGALCVPRLPDERWLPELVRQSGAVRRADMLLLSSDGDEVAPVHQG